MEGKKNDFLDKKLRWDLLPLEEIEDIVKVYTAGSIKYGDNNWQNLENGYQRYKAAMLRHLLEYEKVILLTKILVAITQLKQLGMQQQCCG